MACRAHGQAAAQPAPFPARSGEPAPHASKRKKVPRMAARQRKRIRQRKSVRQRTNVRKTKSPRKKENHFVSKRPENTQRRKVISILSLILIALAFSAIYYFVGRPLVFQFLDSPETFQEYVRHHGPLGPLLMMGIMALQVIVAVIPGEPFELGAGFVFGWFQGSVWCLLGAALATALVYLAVRKWGVSLVELFFSREKILNFSFLQDEKKLDLLVFVLFLIPGTPKDLLTYLIGLTPMKLLPFLALTTIARIPSVVSSTVTGSLAQKENYTAAVITYSITIVLSLICILLYRRMSKRDKEQKAHE